MWRWIATGLLIVSPATGAETARALVCPPNLSYCYYAQKPIEPKMRYEDRASAIKRQLDCLEATMNIDPQGRLCHHLPQ